MLELGAGTGDDWLAEIRELDEGEGLMPTMSGSTSVAAGAQSGNVLLGQQYELAPFDGTLEIGAFAAATGLTCSIFSGPDVLQQPGGFVPFGAAAGNPVYPDHYLWEDEVAVGDRLSLIFNNPTAGAIVVNWAVRLTPA